MNMFGNQMFNPAYVNPNNYAQNQSEIARYQENLRYHQDQNSEVAKAVKAMHDLCDAMNKLDAQHQQEAFFLCLNEMARASNW